jgi:hypothetical protein
MPRSRICGPQHNVPNRPETQSTLIVTARVTVPDANWAVSTYVVVATGLTGKAPVTATAPISEMETLFALIQDQRKTADSLR